ncbi:hypothetical protein [Veillonella sp.]|uniref:hypothetical protein n=1 Tax=Veillonella sp. TaxID=1926307 RepID=UPI0029045E5A|nr:hypothetical protein [Veillonella sp.]MDU2333074.1 hypothetical protein [Veillonella sp.]MDU2346185.1 hypothetical protein [Veillonella sp.]
MIRAYVENRIEYYKKDQNSNTFNNRIISELSAIYAMVDSVLDAEENEADEIASVLARIVSLGNPLSADEFIETLNKD